MITYGRTSGDVRRWPNGAAARRALEEYLAALPPDSGNVTSVLDGGGLDFTGADLSGLELLEAEFSDADLSGVPLVGVHLAGSWLNDANLRNADLSHSSLRKAQARGCDAQEAVAVEADFRGAEFNRANLSRASLRGSNLGDARMLGADLRGADLRNCVMGQVGTWVSLREARMAGCLLDGAHGTVAGPVDVGTDSPQLLDGRELARWFAEHGAEQVEVREPVSH